MDRYNVKITIEGDVGSGKSAIAKVVRDSLMQRDFQRKSASLSLNDGDTMTDGITDVTIIQKQTQAAQ